MIPSLVFKKAKAEDWPQIAHLLVKAQLPLEGAEAHLPNFLLAVNLDNLLGAAALEKYDQVALLRSVVIAERARGNGVGQELVYRLLQEARSEGFEKVVLLTTTAEDYFPRFGFRVIQRAEVPLPVKTSAEFQGACPVSATVMELELPPVTEKIL